VLREKLKKKLPEYMMPRHWVEIKEVPLTANGKVDWRGLPEPEGRVGGGEGKEGPGTMMEVMITGIVEEGLGVAGVWGEDNYVELGGHSLLENEVGARVRERVGVELGLRELFETGTIRELAKVMERGGGGSGRGEGVGGVLPRVRRRGSGERVPLSYAQERLWFLDQLVPGDSLYNIPAAVRLRGELRVEVLEQSVWEVVRRHEVLRTVMEEEGGAPWQEVKEWEEWRG